jgi:NAD(P)H dehydrogenase (quinone)
LSEVENFLSEKQSKYDIIDLYKMNYDPVLHENEHYTVGNRDISLINRIIQEKIKTSKVLIFIYPVWWGTMPAILKGMFDKIITPRFAFYFNRFGIPRPLLSGKRAEVFITSQTNPIILWLFKYHHKDHIKHNILGFAGVKANVHHLGGCKILTERKKNKIKKIVKKALFKYF